VLLLLQLRRQALRPSVGDRRDILRPAAAAAAACCGRLKRNGPWGRLAAISGQVKLL
jgi:hypothetical protein